MSIRGLALAFYLFNPRSSVLATVAWFKARAEALEQQGAASFPKTSLCLVYPPRRNTRIFGSLKSSDCSPRPYLCLCFVLCLRDKTHLAGVWASMHWRASSSEFQPCATHARGAEEMQAEPNTSKSFLKFTPYKDVYTFFIFFFLTISYLSPCRTVTPRRYLSHLHWETGKSFHAWDASINVSFCLEER